MTGSRSGTMGMARGQLPMPKRSSRARTRASLGMRGTKFLVCPQSSRQLTRLRSSSNAKIGESETLRSLSFLVAI